MKRRNRHHNTTGLKTVRSGKTRDQVRRIAARLGIPYGCADQATQGHALDSRAQRNNKPTTRTAATS